ncbi:MAG TPA: hypothetical protein VM030_08810 [Acidimicrobiales bacterium]|nr:hypothetical protein [Acidimicrobiales bacterium]
MRPGESGSGLIATVSGVTVLLVLILFACQLLFALYARSAITAVAFDAARVVAGSRADGSHEGAERDARAALGRYATRVRFTWSVSAETVSLRVQARNPGFLPLGLRHAMGIDDVDRTMRVRRESFRE